jgi:hypothetical protein
MKKLKLDLDALDVTSFTADDRSGSVHSMGTNTVYPCHTPNCASNGATYCCTAEAGCYPSKYCSGPGCVMTVEAGCMTNADAAC